MTRNLCSSLSAWRPCDSTQKAEDGWFQPLVLFPRTKQCHGDCSTVQRTQQQPWSGSAVCYVQFFPAGIYMRELIKESSQENSNNFYCTFLFGLEKTFQLFFFSTFKTSDKYSKSRAGRSLPEWPITGQMCTFPLLVRFEAQDRTDPGSVSGGVGVGNLMSRLLRPWAKFRAGPAG